MTWDKTRPAGSRKIRLSDDDLRENNAALESALSEGHEFNTGGDQTGKHTTPTFINNGADPSAPATSNEITLYNNSGQLYAINHGGAISNVDKNTDIPSGTKMLFKQGSAPSGWTFVAEDGDRVIFHTSTEADGGAIGGNWTISGITIGDHALTKAEMPSHTHELRSCKAGNHNTWGLVDNDACISGLLESESGAISYVTKNDKDDVLIKDAGDGNSHGHGLTADGAWRPAYVSVITCTKD